MRITKRQLRAIIKEELDLATEAEVGVEQQVAYTKRLARELAPEIKEMIYRGFMVSDTTPEGEMELEDSITQLILDWHRSFNRGAYQQD